RVHVVPRLGTLDEDVRLGAKPARIVEGADSDADQIRAGRDPQKQHAAAFRTKRPGYLIAAVCGFDVELRLALRDLEARRSHRRASCVGAAVVALPVAEMAKQRKARFSRTLVPNGPAEAPARHWARHLPYLSSRLVQPECIFPNNVVDPEIVVWVVTLDVVVPDIVDLFPGDRQQRRGLFPALFRLPDQRQAFVWVDFAVDLVDQIIEFLVVPERVILRTALTVPGVEVIRGIEQSRHDCADREVVIPVYRIVEPD